MENQASNKETLNVFIKSRSKTYFQGEALSVSSNNATGVFDILPRHANFITLINDYITVVTQEKEVKKFEIESGVLRVLSDRVNIYLTV